MICRVTSCTFELEWSDPLREVIYQVLVTNINYGCNIYKLVSDFISGDDPNMTYNTPPVHLIVTPTCVVCCDMCNALRMRHPISITAFIALFPIVSTHINQQAHQNNLRIFNILIASGILYCTLICCIRPGNGKHAYNSTYKLCLFKYI